MSSPSKKHHYIPQFYLRGFVDNKGYFIIYDKQLDLFRKSKPSNDFFERNANTTNLGGEKSSFVEEIYSRLESTFASTISAINKSHHPDFIFTDKIITNLKFFVESLRWRNPKLDSVFKKIVKNLSIHNFGLTIQDISNKELKDINTFIMNDQEAIKMLRPFMSATSLTPITEKQYFKSNWQILFQEDGLGLTGDFPIIFGSWLI